MTDPLLRHDEALRLYGLGKSRAEVLEAVYGVAFPDELFRFHDANLDLRLRIFAHPRDLMSPPKRPPLAYHLRIEATAAAETPGLIPLLATGYPKGVPLALNLLGYDVDELRAGRTTIMGGRWPYNVEHSMPRPLRVLGPSLFDVLLDLLRQHRDWLEANLGDVWEEITDADVDEADAKIQEVEAARG